MVDVENSSRMTVSTASGEDTNVSSFVNQGMPLSVTVPPPKKRRNLPGMPDPDAEVVALSPNFLLATNRFVCEICNKGFQRDQNLQLHRRGHNLPWKLKQRTNKERGNVALGDLTGIKKHFSRKHGEKKWKCERCSKKYAVQSDCKAHMKTCGTREYKCDCGTLFSRRDSFITHRAFCDALTGKEGDVYNIKISRNPIGLSPPTPVATCLDASATSTSSTSSTSNVFASIFASSTAPVPAAIPRRASPPSAFPMFCGLARSDCPRLCQHVEQRNPHPSLFQRLFTSPTPLLSLPRRPRSSPLHTLSATGHVCHCIASKSSTNGCNYIKPIVSPRSGFTPSTNQDGNGNQWDMMPDNKTTFAAGLGLVLPLVMKQANNTRPSWARDGCCQFCFVNSYGTGGFNVGEAAAAAAYGGGGRGNSEESWDGVPERKPNGSAASSLKSSI
ncbi:zinc finger protein GAI-ASSOCIATED FACTOR [Salix suchowensis]|nr:zinc finger protein GAI-ASSOCIATED FACTOR [Salix suchowensis]